MEVARAELGLGLAQDVVQSFVEATAAVADVEVMVTDRNLRVIAGTGRIQEEVGESYNAGSLAHRLLRRGKYYYVDKPRSDPRCKNCPSKRGCYHEAVIVHPIRLDSEAIGNICFSALSSRQKERLTNNYRELLGFVNRVSELISLVVKQGLLADRLAYKSQQLATLSNSVNDGILEINKRLVINDVNQTVCRLFGVTPEHVRGTALVEFLDKCGCLDDLREKISLERKSFYVHFPVKPYSALLEIVPLDSVQGYDTGGFVVVHPIDRAGKVSGCQALAAQDPFNTIVAECQSMLEVKDLATKAANTDLPVLIVGETGTGKELLARGIHRASWRRHGPFITLNCAAVPETLLESELFGYEEGAFTGARKGGKPGKFELADKGTLFLDEAGDMSTYLQAKLLRVLEDGLVERLGSQKPRPVDVRVIAATNRNLEEMVQAGSFRCDLLMRLDAFRLALPPLRSRGRKELELLWVHFVEDYSAKLGKEIDGTSSEAMSVLGQYLWPGNVRELKNAAQYAAAVCEGGEITLTDLPVKLQGCEIRQSSNNRATNRYPRKRLQELEEGALKEALSRFGTTGYGKELAAHYLGISRSTLYRKLKEKKIPVD